MNDMLVPSCIMNCCALFLFAEQNQIADELDRFYQGDSVRITQNRCGIVRCVPSQMTLQLVGIDVDDKSPTIFVDATDVLQVIRRRVVQSDHVNGSDDGMLACGDLAELRSGKVGTVRFVGTTHFARGPWIGIELYSHFGPHDDAVRGVRYFQCPPKRGLFVKQFKQSMKSVLCDAAYCKRQCPECKGALQQNVRGEIFCDGCQELHRQMHGIERYYTYSCGLCQKTNFCWRCMLKLQPYKL